MKFLYLSIYLALAGCAVAPLDPQTEAALGMPAREARVAVRNFISVVETVEPVAEAMCKTRAPDLNCDFQIVVDNRPGVGPNAFQTRDDEGRPIIAFTIPLIAIARNTDELAFIMAHEASHHIQRHIDKQRQITVAGAQLFGGLASVLSGGREDAVKAGVEFGAEVGSRTYSKDFELEADALGAVIAARAGYDPVRGAAFFTRLPDPGNKFLGTHPANADRIDTVRAVASRL